MFLWNARSLLNKLNYVQSLFTSKSISILCITETWLHSNVFDHEIVPSGFTVYRRDRTNKRGGGVLIAVCSKIRSKLVFTHSFVEIITIELCLSPKCLFLSCVYVPPNCSDTYYLHLLNHLKAQSSFQDTVIVGDFNVPDTNWTTLSASSHFSQCLCSYLSNNNFVQLVTGPTNTHGNILDIVLTNVPDRLNNVCIDNVNHSSSDHFLISMLLNTSLSKLQSHNGRKFTYMYAKADFIAMNSYFSENVAVETTPNIEDSWQNIKHFLLEARDLFVPNTFY